MMASSKPKNPAPGKAALTVRALNAKRIWIAGHNGMVGRALMRQLAAVPCTLLTADRATLDLRDQAAVIAWMHKSRPDIIVIAAAKVGGILANSTGPATFLYDNLMIAANIIHAAAAQSVEKLLFLGSSCVYPKFASQPIAEDALLTGPLEPTNEAYAIAKIAGIKLAQAYRRQHGCNFITAMPANLYGPHDNFDLASSHVLPALIRKVHEAKSRGAASVEIWGTGLPRREFLHVDDAASACMFLLRHYDDEAPINIGAGADLTILELTRLICEIAGFEGGITHDLTKPDGTPAKLMDSRRLRALGWTPRISLRQGIADVYKTYTAASEGEARQ